jgi:hypothetical protein
VPLDFFRLPFDRAQVFNPFVNLALPVPDISSALVKNRTCAPQRSLVLGKAAFRLCALNSPESTPPQTSTIGPAISFALAAVALILAIYWLTMPTEGAGKWAYGPGWISFKSERSSKTPRVFAASCAVAWLGWSAFLIARRHKRRKADVHVLVLFAMALIA